ncbi:type II toxin-antitoxin system HicA family toxin [Candidatus Woesearchaeota archaeon]|nr:type II toxin-antitoxin system HicA family toxin [Candidatus Woesearchaeota archaeon]
MKLPLLSAEELIRILKKLGVEEIRQKGSHRFFRHPDGRSTVVPVHSGRDIGRGLLRKRLNEIELSRENFLKQI